MPFPFFRVRKKKDEGIRLIPIDVNEHLQEDEAAFSDFEYVRLETTEESMLTDVSKVVVDGDRLYVLPMMDARVFIFSSSGEFVTSLQRGRGPGEVTYVSDMDACDGFLYVLDTYRTIRKYDRNGTYLGDVYTTQDPSFSIKKVEDYFLMFEPYLNKQSDFLLRAVSADSVLCECLPKQKTLEQANFLNYNFYNQGCISYPLSNVIYHWDTASKQLQPAFKIEFQGRNFFAMSDDEVYTNEKMCEINKDKSLYRWIKDVSPLGKKGLYFAFKYDRTYFVKYDGRNTLVYPELIKGLPEVNSAAVGHTEDRMIYAFSSGDLVGHKESAGKEHSPEVAGLYDSIGNEEENPVLVFVDTAR